MTGSVTLKVYGKPLDYTESMGLILRPSLASPVAIVSRPCFVRILAKFYIESGLLVCHDHRMDVLLLSLGFARHGLNMPVLNLSLICQILDEMSLRCCLIFHGVNDVGLNGLMFRGLNASVINCCIIFHCLNELFLTVKASKNLCKSIG